MPRNFSAFSTPALGDGDGLVLLVGLVVEVGGPLLRLGLDAVRLLARLHERGELGELVVEVGGLLRGAGDDQRRARLVDEDVVHLVDDREAVAALVLVLDGDREVVAQVVEAELGVGAVRHVGGVGGVLLVVALLRLDDPDADAEQLVDRAHPLRVAAGQVVVDGDQVDAVAAQRVQDDRQRGGERLALAGLHLRDRAVVQHHAADQLHVEVALAQRALGGLAREREGLGQELVERLAGTRALAQLVGALAKLLVRVQLELGLEVVDAADALLELLELLAFANTKGAVENRHFSESSSGRWAFVQGIRRPSDDALSGD